MTQAFELEDEKLNYDDPVTVVEPTSSRTINWVALIFGIFFVLLGFLDMIIMYVIPNNRIRENKRKLPEATFKRPNAGVISVHFIIHTLIILFGVFLILYGLDVVKHKAKCGLIVIAVLIAFCWIATIAVDFSLTTNVKSQTTVNELQKIIGLTNPIEFAFVYSKDTIESNICHGDNSNCNEQDRTCYSKTGVVIPIKSEIGSPIYEFKNTPEMFYFVYEKDINMSTTFSANYNAIMSNIKKCDPGYKKVTDYYPMNTGTYIVSSNKIPTYLRKSTRIASILFGVGIYYELSSKSVPFITYKQKVNVDVMSNIDYNSIFTSANCESYGRCSLYNNKPEPY